MIEIKTIDMTILTEKDQLDVDITNPEKDLLFKYLTEDEKNNTINKIKDGLSQFIASDKETLLVFKVPQCMTSKNIKITSAILSEVKKYLQQNSKIQIIFIPDTIDISCIQKE